MFHDTALKFYQTVLVNRSFPAQAGTHLSTA